MVRSQNVKNQLIRYAHIESKMILSAIFYALNFQLGKIQRYYKDIRNGYIQKVRATASIIAPSKDASLETFRRLCEIIEMTSKLET